MLLPIIGAIILLIAAWLFLINFASSKKENKTKEDKTFEENKKSSIKLNPALRQSNFLEGKNAKFILFIWCVIITVALIFQAVYFHIQLDNITSELHSVEYSLQKEMRQTESNIWSVENDVENLERGQGRINSRLDDIEYRLRWR